MKKILLTCLFPALGLLSFTRLPDASRLPVGTGLQDGASLLNNAKLPNSTSLPIGAAIPKATVRVKDISGKEVSLQEARQPGGLLVMFTCNTCPYVIRNQSRTKEICAYAKANKIGVILLNANEGDRKDGNSYEAMQSYAKSQDYQWFYAVDHNSELADAFGANRTPESYLFNKEGKLVYKGAIDDSPGDPNEVKRHHLREAIDEMNTGKEITVKETRSIGCSISRG